MKRILLVTSMMLSAVVSSSHAADWVMIKDHSKVTVYADPDTVRGTDGTVIMITLWDHKTAIVDSDSGKTYLSQIGQEQFDCSSQGMRLRPRYITLYSGYMGQGDIVTSTTNPKSTPWMNIAPKSGAEVMWKFACLGTKS